MNRRTFLSAGSFAGLALASEARAQAFRLIRAYGGVLPPPATTIGPASSWNGTAGSGWSNTGGSGVAIPTAPARTTANPAPAAQFWNYSFERFDGSANYLVGVDADAYGGISQVEFYVEGNVGTVSIITLNTQLDPNGIAKNLPGYYIALDSLAFLAQIAPGTWGAIQVYAKAYPVNGSLVPIVIGPLKFWVSTLTNDWSHTVSQNGGGTGLYASIAAAMNAARIAVAKHPEIILADGSVGTPGVYEALDSIGGFTYTPDSLCIIKCAANVGATIQRTTPAIDSGGNSRWQPRIAGMELRGPNLAIDFLNISQQNAFSGFMTVWNGISPTNSIGTLNSMYWDRQPHPAAPISINGPNVAIQFCAISNLDSVFSDIAKVVGNTQNGNVNDGANRVHLMRYNNITNWTIPSAYPTNPAFSVVYTGSATVAQSFSALNNLYLFEDGVLTFTCYGKEWAAQASPHPTGPTQVTETIANEDWTSGINANCITGWAATDDPAQAAKVAAKTAIGTFQTYMPPSSVLPGKNVGLAVSSTTLSATFTGVVSGGVLTVSGYSGSLSLNAGAVVMTTANVVINIIQSRGSGTGGNGTYNMPAGTPDQVTPIAMKAPGTASSNIKGSTATYGPGIDVHPDFMSQFNAGFINAIVGGNVCIGDNFNPLKGDGAGYPPKDFVWKDNCFTGGQTGSIGGGDHALYHNSSYGYPGTSYGFGVNASAPSNSSQFTEIRQCAGYFSNSTWTSIKMIDNMLVLLPGVSLPNSGLGSGNILNTDTNSFTAMFNDPANADFRPVNNLANPVNFKARIELYDGRRLARLATEAIGAWGSTDPAP